jgi:hypothetical protein
MGNTNFNCCECVTSSPRNNSSYISQTSINKNSSNILKSKSLDHSVNDLESNVTTMPRRKSLTKHGLNCKPIKNIKYEYQ